jgi:glucosylceramidase
MKSFPVLIAIMALFLASCSNKVQTVSTTPSEGWIISENARYVSGKGNPDVEIRRSDTLQVIDGFGSCFSELGWTSLSLLSEKEREDVMKELYEPGFGACFNICRMPIGANDYARKWYSCDETPGDFEMKDFSISNDMETLVPFIKNAIKYNPSIYIWASPWSPPSWMKYNKHYASKSLLGNTNFKSEEWGIDFTGINNGLPPDREGREGTDMFIQEDKYFKAYAIYFSKFIEAYREQNINIRMVMPQNEFNSAQVFPSCTWTPRGLANFTGKYLGPVMEKLGVKVMFGTMERPSEAMADTILLDPDCRKYISGAGFQWAGKGAIPGIHKRYPGLKLYQSEQECGNGKNDWKHCLDCWELMKHYFNNGVSVYMYWNTAVKEGGVSTWGWRQNALISVDTVNRTYKYNHEYYLLKHVSHFVKPGARLLRTSGSFGDLLAFRNPDNSVIIVARNYELKERSVTALIDNKTLSILLKPDSFTTVELKAN